MLSFYISRFGMSGQHGIYMYNHHWFFFSQKYLVLLFAMKEFRQKAPKRHINAIHYFTKNLLWVTNQYPIYTPATPLSPVCQEFGKLYFQTWLSRMNKLDKYKTPAHPSFHFMRYWSCTCHVCSCCNTNPCRRQILPRGQVLIAAHRWKHLIGCAWQLF